jgi:hypothetical protein
VVDRCFRGWEIVVVNHHDKEAIGFGVSKEADEQ